MNSPLEKVETRWSKKAGIHLFVKRDDLLHPLVSGNKFRKLKYNLVEAKEQRFETILSFGGAYSNHIHALSSACRIHGFKSIGIIRGDEIRPLNHTLAHAEKEGMHLRWVSREDYKKKDTPEFIQSLKKKYGEFYLVPEGGTNQTAVKGTAEIIPEIEIPFDYICTPVGTGGTIAGMIRSCPTHSKVLGFSALKGDFLIKEVADLLSQTYENWEMNTGFHFGGYAKTKPELWEFIDNFKSETGIQLEAIYNGKMMFGIAQLAKSGFFKTGETVIGLHTGGLQGLKSMI